MLSAHISVCANSFTKKFQEIIIRAKSRNHIPPKSAYIKISFNSLSNVKTKKLLLSAHAL
jgi:hypothetical protein